MRSDRREVAWTEEEQALARLAVPPSRLSQEAIDRCVAATLVDQEDRRRVRLLLWLLVLWAGSVGLVCALLAQRATRKPLQTSAPVPENPR